MNLRFRKKNIKSQSNIILVLLALFLTSFSIGFAYLEERLNIKGVTAITKVNFNVQFENLTIDTDGVSASVPATISGNKRQITFSVSLKDIIDYYQFEADVVNKGTIDAMIGVAEITGIPDSLKEFIECRITYVDGIEIKENDPLKVGNRERIKARIGFKEGIDLGNILSDETFDLVLEIPYIEATDDIVNGCKYFFKLTRELACLDNQSSEFVTSDTGINFFQGSSNTNGKGLYIYTDENGDIYNPENPIYYYRGDVVNNNVIFADFCWKIVRTTETGGIKLIYNGAITSGNTCNATGIDATIDKQYYNINSTRIENLGYNDINSTYSNKDTRMKAIIDSWYKTYILYPGFNGYLEDTIWCNDKSGPLEVNDGDWIRSYYGYGIRVRNQDKPIVTCPLRMDSYTVSSTNGNGALKYPIALLTADEVMLAGVISSNSYLNIHLNCWTMSPNYTAEKSSSRFAYMSSITSYGVGSTSAKDELYVRPSISLSSRNTFFTIGTGDKGSVTNPYIVKKFSIV